MDLNGYPMLNSPTVLKFKQNKSDMERCQCYGEVWSSDDSCKVEMS